MKKAYLRCFKKESKTTNYMLFALAYSKLKENALQGNQHLERLFDGSKIENYNRCFFAGHGKQNDAPYMLYRGLTDAVTRNKTLPCSWYRSQGI